MAGGIVKGIAVVICLALVIGGGLWIAGMLPSGNVDPDTMTVKFTAWDSLAGSQDATTSAVDIYLASGGTYEKQESVTMDAAQKESAFTYTTGQVLYLKLYDSTDTSICTQYMTWDVPQASPAQVYDGSFQCKLPFIDKGDTTKDILVKNHNNTAIAASATIDVTDSGWNSAYAEIDVELRALNDDTGYKNSKNFLKNYENNHYFVIKASGTGWDSVFLLNSGGWTVYEKASVRYFVYKLSDDDITRDKKSEGFYDPDGVFTQSLVFDLTGFESGDSVTFAYEYRWYGSFEYFQNSGSWGSDSSSTAESITIQY